MRLKYFQTRSAWAKAVAAWSAGACLMFASINDAGTDLKPEAHQAGTPTTLAGVTDVTGRAVDPFAGGAKATVLVFLNPECPIANRYAPEIQRLAKLFEPRDAKFWLVYPEAGLAAGAIQKHLKEYGYSLRAVRDPKHVLVKRAQVLVTPEAAVFDAKGRLVYHGRIDDRYVDFGKERFAPTERDLENAVNACLANKTVRQPATKAIGCYIPE